MIIDFQKHADGPALVVRAEGIAEGIDLGLLITKLQAAGIAQKKWGSDGIRIELASRGRSQTNSLAIGQEAIRQPPPDANSFSKKLRNSGTS